LVPPGKPRAPASGLPFVHHPVQAAVVAAMWEVLGRWGSVAGGCEGKLTVAEGQVAVVVTLLVQQ